MNKCTASFIGGNGELVYVAWANIGRGGFGLTVHKSRAVTFRTAQAAASAVRKITLGKFTPIITEVPPDGE
jgi:hypothetical protein